jgi:hypothetical protein
MSQPMAVSAARKELGPEPLAQLASVVEVSEVTKRFGKLTVLDRVSLKIRRLPARRL